MTECIDQPNVQEDLSVTRTLLALDRTLLAWIRTSLSLIAFGFTLARFVHDLILTGSLHGVDARYPRELGITLMVLGIGGLLGGALDHWRTVKRLRGKVHISPWCSSLVVAVVIIIAGMILMVNLLTNLAG